MNEMRWFTHPSTNGYPVPLVADASVERLADGGGRVAIKPSRYHHTTTLSHNEDHTIGIDLRSRAMSVGPLGRPVFHGRCHFHFTGPRECNRKFAFVFIAPEVSLTHARN